MESRVRRQQQQQQQQELTYQQDSEWPRFDNPTQMKRDVSDVSVTSRVISSPRVDGNPQAAVQLNVPAGLWGQHRVGVEAEAAARLNAEQEAAAKGAGEQAARLKAGAAAARAAAEEKFRLKAEREAAAAAE